VPQAPRYLEGRMIWADRRAILLDSNLAFDVASQQWWELSPPAPNDEYGDVVLWAGDRLFVWGYSASKAQSPHEVSFVAVPDW
jgi:hypothetical protein